MKEKKGLIITLSVVTVFVVAIVLAYVFAGDYIVNQLALMTKSDKEYFEWIVNKNNTVAKKGLEESTSGEKLDKSFPSNVSGNFKVESNLSTEFLSLLDIESDSSKSGAVDVHFSASDKEAGTELKLNYNGNDLLALRFELIKATQKLLFQLPTYKEDIIDITGLYEQEDETGKSMKSILASLLDGTATEQSANQADSVELSKYIDIFTDSLLNTAGEVNVTKGYSASIDDQTVKYNQISVSVSYETLLKEVNEVLKTLYSIETNEAEKTQLKKLIDELQSVNPEDLNKLGLGSGFEYAMYINSRGNIIGGMLKLSVTGQNIKFSAVSKCDKNSAKFDFDVEMDVIKALSVKVRSEKKEDLSNVTIEAKLGSMINTMFGAQGETSVKLEFKDCSSKIENGKLLVDGKCILSAKCDRAVLEYIGIDADKFNVPEYQLVTEIHGTGTEASFAIDLLHGDKSCANLKITGKQQEGVTESFIDENREGIINYDEISNSGYLEMTALYDFVDELRVKINEKALDEVLDQLCEMFFGQGYDFNALGVALGKREAEVPESENNVNNQQALTSDENKAEAQGIPSEDYRAAYVRAERMGEYPQAGAVYYYCGNKMNGYAQPGQYRGIEYAVEQPQDITEEMFEEYKQAFLSNCEGRYRNNITDRGVELGDEIEFDVSLVLGGTVVDAYSYNDCYAKLGEYAYGEGADDEIVGMMVGDSKDIELTLNENYGEFAGTTATFRLTLKAAYQTIEPEWSEAFICGTVGFNSLDECSDAIMESLKNSITVSEDEMISDIVSLAMENTVFYDVPESLYNELWMEVYYSIYDYTLSGNLTPEEYFEKNNVSTETLYNTITSDTKRKIRTNSFYAAIAEAENITVSGEELQQIVENYISIFNMDSYEMLLQEISLEDIIDYQIQVKIDALIYENAVITNK